ncbi:MAG: SGNH/GDSL hydrolase family protein, partial [Opitutaceae bacterium]|nr:SGNH/GDSL hydrolase family protein [Cytophagales bacterium]
MKIPSFCFLIVLLVSQYVYGITPNPILSRGKSASSSKGNVSYLTDNKYGGTSFAISNNSWVALKVGTGPSKVFFNWNSPAYTWSDVIASAGSCKSNMGVPMDYTIQKSANSTNGADGQWTTVLTVSGSNVTARGHLVDFAGASWIKMNISNGGGNLDEIEVFDMSANGNDLWFFPGTSITANTYKGTPPAQNYADLITQTYPGYNPVMVKAGIPCISSSNLATDLSKYLSNAGNAKYWAIEMGTNDAWGGGNGNVNLFKNNLQTVITACKNAGIQPILARMIGTNQAAVKWQVHPDFLKAIDDLTTQNNLIAGPDLYTWFSTHPSELNTDGVHPNAAGAASIQKMWAEKMKPLYASTPKDCNGIAGGTASTDACGVCIGGTTGRQACKTLAPGSYAIKPVHFMLCLENGATVLQQNCTSANNQIWTATKTGNYY